MQLSYLFGGGIFFIIPALACWGVYVYTHNKQWLVSLVGTVSLWFCYSILMHDGAYDGPLVYTSGLFGHALYSLAALCMPESAIYLLCWVLAVCGILLITGYSWAAYISNAIKSVLSEIPAAPTQEVQEVSPETLIPIPTTPDRTTSVIVKTKPQPRIQQDVAEPEYPFPQLAKSGVTDQHQVEKNTALSQSKSQVLEEKLLRFGIRGTVTHITVGPVVTLYEYQPHIETKISKILAREDDLALALQAVSLRIIAPIPGKSVIGFEVAHAERTSVYFHALYEPGLKKFKGSLPLVLGQNTVGSTVVVDLMSMPHLLVAGSTGSGKSVALNTMLCSLLSYASPQALRLILIDPKKLEFAVYADLPHLLFPIITSADKAIHVLRWAITTMNERYDRMSKVGIRQAKDYHAVYGDMASIVIVIDEFADLMISSGKEIEELIVRLAQMARAAGIHIILATQRPSVDVITGLIKVNFPARMAFKVTSKIDSRTIIDTIGADKLLGKGDMLFLDNQGLVHRIHGAYMSDAEIATLVEQVKRYGAPIYETLDETETTLASVLDETDKQLFDEIVAYVRECDEISISLLQRKFRIGYNRSARMMDTLESHGIILPSDGGKMRKVLH